MSDVKTQDAEFPHDPVPLLLEAEFPFSIKEMKELVEKHFFSEALERTDGNIAQAAKLLCLNRTTLLMRLQRLGMHDGTTPSWKAKH